MEFQSGGRGLKYADRVQDCMVHRHDFWEAVVKILRVPCEEMGIRLSALALSLFLV